MEEIILSDDEKALLDFLSNRGLLLYGEDNKVTLGDVWNQKVFNYIYDGENENTTLQELNDYIIKRREEKR